MTEQLNQHTAASFAQIAPSRPPTVHKLPHSVFTAVAPFYRRGDSDSEVAYPHWSSRL